MELQRNLKIRDNIFVFMKLRHTLVSLKVWKIDVKSESLINFIVNWGEQYGNED